MKQLGLVGSFILVGILLIQGPRVRGEETSPQEEKAAPLVPEDNIPVPPPEVAPEASGNKVPEPPREERTNDLSPGEGPRQERSPQESGSQQPPPPPYPENLPPQQPLPPPPPHRPHPTGSFRHLLIGVKDGGGSVEFSENLKEAVAGAGYRNCLHLLVQSWSQYDAIKADYRDHRAHLKGAHQLAAKILTFKHQCPHSKVFLIGYGAGARVVLAALEMLPPHTVDRIVLLGASVSCSYNLCHALAVTTHGIDNFFSPADAQLNNLEDSMGTSDGRKTATAGRVGFLRNPYCDYSKLRQYPWSERFEQYGHQGDHFGYSNVDFLKRVVLPLVLGYHCPRSH